MVSGSLVPFPCMLGSLVLGPVLPGSLISCLHMFLVLVPVAGVFSPLPMCIGVLIPCPLQSLTLHPRSTCVFLMAQHHHCLHHGWCAVPTAAQDMSGSSLT